MKTLFYIFMAFFWYGLITNLMGAALLSFALALFILYCAKRMEREQQAWLNSPDSAKEPPDALVLLDSTGSECCASGYRP